MLVLLAAIVNVPVRILIFLTVQVKGVKGLVLDFFFGPDPRPDHPISCTIDRAVNIEMSHCELTRETSCPMINPDAACDVGGLV